MSVVFELVSDPRGVITIASHEAAAVLAVDERWLVGKPLATFVALRDRPRFRTLLLDFERGRRTAAREDFTLASRLGEEVVAHAAATSRNGHISWKVEAETALPLGDAAVSLDDADQQRLFAQLLTRLPHGVLVVDRDLRIVYANPAVRRIIGTGARGGDPLPEPWDGFSLRDLARSLFTGDPPTPPQLVESEDATYAVEGQIAANMPTATLLLEDVTEREHARRSERRFVENAAHELRTPLAAITSVVDVLERGAKDDPATRDSFLAHIRTHSDRLTRLATSLLVLARIQTGEQRPQLDLVVLEPLLAEIAARLVPRKGVEVEVSAPPALAVLADRDLLLHAFENIGANAVKHTTQGTITFEARDLGGHTEIEIRDTGAGMTREDSAHAVDRFYRGNRPVPDGGFGLGLAIADEAVRALGGTLRLESPPSAGTRVRVCLPSARVVG